MGSIFLLSCGDLDLLPLRIPEHSRSLSDDFCCRIFDCKLYCVVETAKVVGRDGFAWGEYDWHILFLQGSVPFGKSLERFFKVGSWNYIKFHRAYLGWCDAGACLLVSFSLARVLCIICRSSLLLLMPLRYFWNQTRS